MLLCWELDGDGMDGMDGWCPGTRGVVGSLGGELRGAKCRVFWAFVLPVVFLLVRYSLLALPYLPYPKVDRYRIDTVWYNTEG